mgnify:CR=1 FL=1
MVKLDDSEVINFLLQTEIIPLCLRIMDSTSSAERWPLKLVSSTEPRMASTIARVAPSTDIQRCALCSTTAGDLIGRTPASAFDGHR